MTPLASSSRWARSLPAFSSAGQRRRPAWRAARCSRPQPVEPTRRLAAGGRELRGDHRDDRRRHRPPPRLRLGHLGRRPDRNPVQRRSRDPEEGRRRLLLRRRERSRPVPDPGEAEDRVGQRPPRPDRPDAAPASSTSSTTLKRAGGTWKAGSGAIWSLKLERGAAGRLDVGGRGGAADPPRARALRRGRRRGDHARAPVHRPADAARLRLPGAPRRQRPDRPEPAADGPAPAAARRLPDAPASRGRRGSCSRR